MQQKISIGIDGMHCASCSARVEKALAGTPGVSMAHVNLALEEASLEYDDKQVKPEQFDRLIASLGFSVRQEAQLSEDEHIRAMHSARRKMQVVWAITIVVTVFMASHMLYGRMLISHVWDSWIVFILSLAAMLFPARGVYVSAFRSVKSGSANMDVLIAMGTLASLAVWPLSQVIKGIDPHAFSGIAAMILAFHLTGRYLENRARGKASEAIRKLINLGAKTALILVDGVETEVSIRKIKQGDIFVVKPGMKVPTDGVIVSGNANLDEALVTGESLPVARSTGDTVLGATVNLDGYFTARADKIGEDTFLAQVIHLVQEAQHSKVPIQLLADRVTAVFVPVIIVLASITFAAWLIFPDALSSMAEALRQYIPLSSHSTGLAAALMASIATLVIACPCALGLATPTALMVGSGIGARKGVLIRNGEALQTMKDVRAMVFDKTGTLTYGKPRLIGIQVFKGDEDGILAIAAAIESGSAHPLAIAVCEAAATRKLNIPAITAFSSETGKGLTAEVDGQRYYLGSAAYMRELGIALPAEGITDPRYAYAGQIWMADTELRGAFFVADELRKEAAQVVQTLRERGIEPIMISGDNKATAAAIAAQCGITRFFAEALPGHKSTLITALQKEYGVVAMVGDGINDAPALKQANIGIAMGKGTDIAIEAADITIMRDDLNALPLAVNLSVQTFRKIRQNLFWAFFYNLIAIPLAVMGILHPVLAEIAMASSSVTVVTNANMLRRKF